MEIKLFLSTLRKWNLTLYNALICFIVDLLTEMESEGLGAIFSNNQQYHLTKPYNG